MPCYSGDNPVQTIEEGMEIWKWAKANGIDRGLSFDQIHDLINKEYFGGTAKPHWITEVLAGRKTPFRKVANDVWRAQANRRVVVAHAKDVAGRAAMPQWQKAMSKIWEAPRSFAVAGHGYVFPITHAGDLVFQPSRWATLWRGLKNTWTKTGDPLGITSARAKVETEQVMNTMQKDPMFNMAINSGVDLAPKAHGSELVNKGSQSERAWSMLKVMRFELWKNDFEKMLSKHPELSADDQLELGKRLAIMANHATGSGKGAITNSKVLGQLLFGSKLTQSKINRLFDVGKTLKTYGNWGNASPVEKIAANTHFTQLAQYALTYAGFMAVNQGYLMARGQKDKDGKPTRVNWSDPTKSDWMKFKGEGLEASVPGIRSELKVLGNILAIAFKDSKQVKKQTHGGTKFDLATDALKDYAISKLAPTAHTALEAAYGTETFGLHRPMPWSSEKGTAKKPKMDWSEYAISHGPIPLEGPIKYVYDQLKQRGASATDATSFVKALMLFGADPAAMAKGVAIGVGGLPGFHVGVDYNAAKAQQKTADALKRR
jgi:hypothetical protein